MYVLLALNIPIDGDRENSVAVVGNPEALSGYIRVLVGGIIYLTCKTKELTITHFI